MYSCKANHFLDFILYIHGVSIKWRSESGRMYSATTVTADGLFPSVSVFVVYAGVVPAKNREIGYSIVFIWYSVGHMVEYFISPYISLEANILLILAMTVVAVSQFSMADYYFGSASSAKCWGWCKRPAAGLGEGEAQQANGKPWCLASPIRTG